ncbi:MAG: hypothetical protein M1834_006933 [Cirrosporium novae-zelandiae]|nr:MAG: hypothetical protein M1834_006933 [Cirrosporium novae-zelandiae]
MSPIELFQIVNYLRGRQLESGQLIEFTETELCLDSELARGLWARGDWIRSETHEDLTNLQYFLQQTWLNQYKNFRKTRTTSQTICPSPLPQAPKHGLTKRLPTFSEQYWPDDAPKVEPGSQDVNNEDGPTTESNNPLWSAPPNIMGKFGPPLGFRFQLQPPPALEGNVQHPANIGGLSQASILPTTMSTIGTAIGIQNKFNFPPTGKPTTMEWAAREGLGETIQLDDQEASNWPLRRQPNPKLINQANLLHGQDELLPRLPRDDYEFEECFSQLKRDMQTWAETWFCWFYTGPENEKFKLSKGHDPPEWLGHPQNSELLEYINWIGYGYPAWRLFFEHGYARQALVYGILGKVIEVHVLNHPMFGMEPAAVDLIESVDKTLKNKDGFERTFLRSQAANALFSGQEMPPNFSREVHEVTVKTYTMFLPLFHSMYPQHWTYADDPTIYSDDPLPPPPEKDGNISPAGVLYYHPALPGLYNIFTLAATISLALRLSPTLYHITPISKLAEWDAETMNCINTKGMELCNMSRDQNTVPLVNISCFPLVVAYRKGNSQMDENSDEDGYRSRPVCKGDVSLRWLNPAIQFNANHPDLVLPLKSYFKHPQNLHRRSSPQKRNPLKAGSGMTERETEKIGSEGKSASASQARPSRSLFGRVFSGQGTIEEVEQVLSWEFAEVLEELGLWLETQDPTLTAPDYYKMNDGNPISKLLCKHFNLAARGNIRESVRYKQFLHQPAHKSFLAYAATIKDRGLDIAFKDLNSNLPAPWAGPPPAPTSRPNEEAQPFLSHFDISYPFAGVGSFANHLKIEAMPTDELFSEISSSLKKKQLSNMTLDDYLKRHNMSPVADLVRIFCVHQGQQVFNEILKHKAVEVLDKYASALRANLER